MSGGCAPRRRTRRTMEMTRMEAGTMTMSRTSLTAMRTEGTGWAETMTTTVSSTAVHRFK